MLFHISPSFFATSPMDRPGCSPLIFGRNSEQNKKKAELQRKIREDYLNFRLRYSSNFWDLCYCSLRAVWKKHLKVRQMLVTMEGIRTEQATLQTQGAFFSQVMLHIQSHFWQDPQIVRLYIPDTEKSFRN